MYRKNNQHEDATIIEKFPNEAKVGDGEARLVHENNFFKDHETAVIKKKYLQFTVFMEALNEVLELDRYATVETFARRIQHLIEKETSIPRYGEDKSTT